MSLKFNDVIDFSFENLQKISVHLCIIWSKCNGNIFILSQFHFVKFGKANKVINFPQFLYF